MHLMFRRYLLDGTVTTSECLQFLIWVWGISWQVVNYLTAFESKILPLGAILREMSKKQKIICILPREV